MSCSFFLSGSLSAIILQYLIWKRRLCHQFFYSCNKYVIYCFYKTPSMSNSYNLYFLSGTVSCCFLCYISSPPVNFIINIYVSVRFILIAPYTWELQIKRLCVHHAYHWYTLSSTCQFRGLGISSSLDPSTLIALLWLMFCPDSCTGIFSINSSNSVFLITLNR